MTEGLCATHQSHKKPIIGERERSYNWREFSMYVCNPHTYRYVAIP